VLTNSRARSVEGPAADGTGTHRPLLSGVRTRVLVSFLVLLVVSTAASLFVLREVLLSRISDRVTDELASELEPLESLERGQPRTGEPWRDLESLFDAFLSTNSPPPTGVFGTFVGREPYRAVSSGDAATESRLPDAIAALESDTTPSSGTVETEEGEAVWIGIPASVDSQTGSVIAAALTTAERDQVEDAVRLAVGVSLVVLLLASLFIWLAAGRVVAPLQAVARTARAISETDLSGRIPVQGSDEIAELGRTFNGMLDRLETAFAGQKDFITDVSHELRTPITVIRGHLETLGDSPREREEAIMVIQDELDRMSRYVDDLLLLTKAPRPDFLRLAPVDLDLFTHDLFAKARSLGDREWRLDKTGVGIVVADQDRLTQAMMNLVENAVRHTDEGDKISLGTSLEGDEARLWVNDEGPGVDPADRERIFSRFARADSGSHRSAEGAGLGLSIVEAIAQAHGGSIDLHSELGKGSTFVIVLPAAPTA
jgi:signal transduction histidine kinase